MQKINKGNANKSLYENTEYKNYFITQMKSILHIIVAISICCILLTLSSCNKDDKTLAADAIKEFMNNNANDPHSYESVFLKIDSTNSNYYSAIIVDEAISLINKKESLENYEHDEDADKELAELWNGIDSQYAKKEFEKYKGKYINSFREYRTQKIEYMHKLFDFQMLLKYANSKKFKKAKYAYNRYRIKDEDGNLILVDMIFLLSDDFKKVSGTIDYNLLESMKKKKIIETLASEKIVYE
mgnify:CR=1 FL=1